MIYISKWDRANADGERRFSGYLTEPQFQGAAKLVSAETWTVIVNYRKGTIEIWRGRIRLGVPTGDGERVAVIKDFDAAYRLDTVCINWEQTFERFLSDHGLKAWEPPEGWEWPAFVKDW